jgi:hypothetical protein
MSTRKPMPGLQARHRAGCPGPREDGKCCQPAWRAEVFDHRSGKKIRRTFPTKSAAKLWRQDALVALRQGDIAAVNPTGRTLRDALDELLTGMRNGTVLDRSGRRYRPATIRSYREAIDKYLAPRLGHLRLAEVRRADAQALVDEMHASGLAGSTVRNKLDPLRVVYRRALQDDELARHPLEKLRLPANTGRPREIANPDRGRAPRRVARRRARGLGHRVLRGPPRRRVARPTLAPR